MKEFFETRLQWLRVKLKETGKIEYEYRYRELMRAYEHWQISQLGSVS